MCVRVWMKEMGGISVIYYDLKNKQKLIQINGKHSKEPFKKKMKTV